VYSALTFCAFQLIAFVWYGRKKYVFKESRVYDSIELNKNTVFTSIWLHSITLTRAFIEVKGKWRNERNKSKAIGTNEFCSLNHSRFLFCLLSLKMFLLESYSIWFFFCWMMVIKLVFVLHKPIFFWKNILFFHDIPKLKLWRDDFKTSFFKMYTLLDLWQQ
jgi:hypothetical protein